LTGSGTIALPLARHPRSRKRMVVAPAGRGWHAETEYQPLAHTDDVTLVQLRMRTGVTHQLRAHLAQLGHPVIGDRRYGRSGPSSRPGPATSASCGTETAAWHYLHALRMRSDDPEVLGAVLATPFPQHWAPLFARLGWPLDASPSPATP